MAKLVHPEINGYGFPCPGCKSYHVITTQKPQGNPVWTFNGNIASPTFSPSLLCRTGPMGPFSKHPGMVYVCHSFIKDGKIQFLGDCTHDLKNQTVPLRELDDLGYPVGEEKNAESKGLGEPKG